MEIEYRLVTATCVWSLEVAVRNAAKNDWRVTGGMTTWKDWGKRRYFGQAIVREVELTRCEECGTCYHKHCEAPAETAA